MLACIYVFLNPQMLHKCLIFILPMYEDHNLHSFAEVLLKDTQLLNKLTVYTSTNYCIQSKTELTSWIVCLLTKTEYSSLYQKKKITNCIN